MLKAIAKPFGVLMLWLYNLTGNYGVAVILFALVVKLIMLPFQLKSKKSMMRVTRLTPRLKELEKKFGNDQQRYQQEMAKLYKEEGASPMSGCLWSLLPFPILIALYNAIRYPLTTMMGVPESLLAEGGALFEKLAAMGYQAGSGRAAFYDQIYQSKFITENFSSFTGISDKLQEISYNFLGLDLSQTPSFSFWRWDFSDPSAWGPALGLFMIPVLSALLSWLSMKVANASNPQVDQQQQQMKTMNLIMPLMSLYICFTMPAVMGIYWIAQSVFATVQDVILNKVYTKQLDIEDADRIEREKAREAELEAKRKQTEKLKAEGATTENRNTSKKNKRAVAAQKEVERKAAEVRAAKLAKKGLTEEEIPASQVGDRRYARGRAYVPDRYSNPDEAEAKTQAAAQESELYDQTAAQESQQPSEAEGSSQPEESAGGDIQTLDTGLELAAATETAAVPAEEPAPQEEPETPAGAEQTSPEEPESAPEEPVAPDGGEQ